jgi:hypothetical protein
MEAETVFSKISAQQYVTNVLCSETYMFYTHTLPSLEVAKAWLHQLLILTYALGIEKLAGAHLSPC